MKLSLSFKASLLSILLVVVTTGTLTYVFYSSGTSLLVKHAVEDFHYSIKRETSGMQSLVNDMYLDANLLSKLPETMAVLDTGVPRADTVPVLQNIFKQFISYRAKYTQVRLLDENGQEIVRIHQDKNSVEVITGNDLQNKSESKYFINAIHLPPGDIYTSSIDLNREHGSIVIPHQPVIRISIPVYLGNKTSASGIIVINMDVGGEFERIQNNYKQLDRMIYITNARGDFLVHPNPGKTFGFEFDKPYRAQEEFTSLEKFFLPDNRETSITQYPKETGTGNVVAFTRVFLGIDERQQNLVIGFVQPYQTLAQLQGNLLKQNFWWGAVLIVLGAMLAVMFTAYVTKPLNQIIHAIETFTRGEESTFLPASRQDELGLLARAFNSMFNQIRQSQKNLRELNDNLEETIDRRTHELRTSEEKTRTILETVVDGIITINDKGIVQSFNPSAERIFGYSSAEVIGKNIKMLMPDPYSQEHDGYLSNYMNTGVARIIGIGREVMGKRRNGETFPLDLAVSQMEIEGEVMFTGLVRDITDRKKMENMKNEFVSTVSHELRTPLTSIRGSLGLITGGAAGVVPESMKEMLKIAENNTQRLLLLINDILDTQKIESGSMKFRFNRHDVMSIIEQAVHDNATYATQHDVRLEISNRCDDLYVLADKDRIQQVLNNLISNACKFSHAGGKVDISVAHHNAHVRISITDHGVGVPDEFKPHIFEKFTQSDSSDSRSKGGTGLGMSISKLIMEKHGGMIDFISRKDVGSTFFIELPEFGQQADLSKNPHSVIKKDEHRSCILILEDDPDVATLLQRLVVEAGFSADIAYNTGQARELLKENAGQYKVITVDVMLPGEDGISFMNSLRADPATRDLPVVIVSVCADEKRVSINGGAVGVIDWISKPIDETRLIDALKKASTHNGKPRVLHIEDDPDVHRVVELMLKDLAEQVWTRTLKESRAMLEQEKFDVVLLDIGLPDGSGLDLLEAINHLQPKPEIIIFSAQDVSHQYADQVAVVLSKSRSSERDLLSTIKQVIKP